MRRQLPTASDVAILVGAFWESRPVVVARAAVAIVPALAIICALAAAAWVNDRIGG